MEGLKDGGTRMEGTETEGHMEGDTNHRYAHSLVICVCSCTAAPATVHSSVTAHYCTVCRIMSKFCCLATTVCCTQTAPLLSPPRCHTVRCSAIACRLTVMQAALSTLSTNPSSGTSIDGQTDTRLILITALPPVCRAKSADSKPLAAAAAAADPERLPAAFSISSQHLSLPSFRCCTDHVITMSATSRRPGRDACNELLVCATPSQQGKSRNGCCSAV